MGFATEFTTIALPELPELNRQRKAEGWRFVQLLGVNNEAGVDLIYSFMKDGLLVNSKIEGVTKDQVVPSITDNFLAAFVFENETHDLFGVNFEGIAIDFGGNFYALAQKEPMTIISPEQKAAREKARKIAEAKAAKEKAAKAGDAPAQEQPKAAPAADELEAKLAGMDPEKAAKVRAAMEAKAKKEAARKAEAANDGEGA